MHHNNSLAKKLAIIAGILLLLSGGSGVTALLTLEKIGDALAPSIFDSKLFVLIFSILLILASLGGISVITGGVLIGRKKVLLGKILIQIGSGAGVIGLVLMIFFAIRNNSFLNGGFVSVGSLGLILAALAVIIAKKK